MRRRMGLKTEGHWFVDREGNRILLRGVNLGGSSKVPLGGETHLPANFGPNVSFVGRPFPLTEADEHFTRLRHWGFNCLRLLTTWEAIEHSGSGNYDIAYLDYFEKLVEIAGEYGFWIFVDPHQDVWSRATGGDGAPHWLFEKVGMDYRTFDRAEAALTMQGNYPENYPPMSWTSNYNRFATATMFTLFFGGRKFATSLEIDGLNVQDYLQHHYIGAIETLAERLAGFDHVIGFDSMNEPHNGYIGYPDIRDLPEIPIPGKVFSPFEAMQAAAGLSVKVKEYGIKLFNLRPLREVMLNPEGVSIWIDDDMDLWRNEGIWKLTSRNPEVLKPHHFWVENFIFFRDFIRPFAVDYIERLRALRDDWIFFLEGNPVEGKVQWHRSDPRGVVNASHWYDTLTLFTRKFQTLYNVDLEHRRPVLFKRGIRRLFRRQLEDHILDSQQIHGGIPTFIRECGLPFNLQGGKSFVTGDFSSQEAALTFYYELMDELLLHTTLWNYTSDNCNKWGDNWNLEDLSIFSRDQGQSSNLDSGGRAIKGFCRPYPRKFKGNLLGFEFRKGRFNLKIDFENDGFVEIFLPSQHFSDFSIECGSCIYEKGDDMVRVSGNGKVRIVIRS